MPRAIWTGTISFGLVTVPVRLYSAIDRKTVRFHQLSGKTGARIAHAAPSRHGRQSRPVGGSMGRRVALEHALGAGKGGCLMPAGELAAGVTPVDRYEMATRDMNAIADLTRRLYLDHKARFRCADLRNRRR